MDGIRGTFGVYLTVAISLCGIFAMQRIIHREREFCGMLINGPDIRPAVMGWPCVAIQLKTPTGTYALDFDDVSKWRTLLDEADGKQVIVRGIMRKWHGKYRRGHLRVTVCELRLVTPVPLK